MQRCFYPTPSSLLRWGSRSPIVSRVRLGAWVGGQGQSLQTCLGRPASWLVEQPGVASRGRAASGPPPGCTRALGGLRASLLTCSPLKLTV